MDSPLIANTNVQSVSSADQTIDLAYGATLTDDAAAFEASLKAVQTKFASDTESISEIARAAIKPLEFIDTEAQSLSDYANSALESGNQLTPGEIVKLTVQSHKFMFYSQLTANVANRSADGVTQLFRQQG